MNRSHNVQTAVESVENSKKAGFKINIEFIFGHPGQTIDNWIDVVESAISLDILNIEASSVKS